MFFVVGNWSTTPPYLHTQGGWSHLSSTLTDLLLFHSRGPAQTPVGTLLPVPVPGSHLSIKHLCKSDVIRCVPVVYGSKCAVYQSGHSSASCWNSSWRKFGFDFVPPGRLPAGCCSDLLPSRCDQSPDRSTTIVNIYHRYTLILPQWSMVYQLLGGRVILAFMFPLQSCFLLFCFTCFLLPSFRPDRLKLHLLCWKQTHTGLNVINYLLKQLVHK